MFHGIKLASVIQNLGLPSRDDDVVYMLTYELSPGSVIVAIAIAWTAVPNLELALGAVT